MSAIRVPRTRRENTVQQRDATLPGGDLDLGPGPHLDQNVLGQLRRGNPQPRFWSLSGGLFSDAARPCQRPAPLLWRKRGTRKSRLETKTENEALFRPSSASLVTPDPAKPRPTARKISRVSAVPQLAGLGGGWCRLELSGLGKRWFSFWRKSSNRKASGDSGGFEFLEFLDAYTAFARRLFYALSGFNHDAHFGPSSFSTVI